MTLRYSNTLHPLKRRDQTSILINFNYSNAMSEDRTPANKPKVEQFPVLNDDSSKPRHSYATLIGMAILRARNKRLTLAQIYKWISDTYSYYNSGDAGWQNGIRHNLSLNKAFIKQKRCKDDSGKRNYWAMAPNKELLSTKKSSMLLTAITLALQKLPPTSSSSFMPQHSFGPAGAESFMASQAPVHKNSTTRPKLVPLRPSCQPKSSLQQHRRHRLTQANGRESLQELSLDQTSRKDNQRNPKTRHKPIQRTRLATTLVNKSSLRSKECIR